VLPLEGFDFVMLQTLDIKYFLLKLRAGKLARAVAAVKRKPNYSKFDPPKTPKKGDIPVRRL